MSTSRRSLMRRALDRRFALMTLVYIGVVLLVWHWNWPEHVAAREYVAARELAHNHRIVSYDLRRPDGLATSLGFYMISNRLIEGRYIKTNQPIMPGQSISPECLADEPDMQLPDKMRAVVFTLPSDSRLIGLLDVGSPVALLGQDPDSKAAVSIPALVHAILCEPSSSDGKNCYPILRVSVDRIQFVTKNQSALRLVLGSQP